MATTFVGVELAGDKRRARHAAVVLQRRKMGVELRHWSCLINSECELLEYLATMAGTSGVIALHGSEGDACSMLERRVWRVLDYRLLFALAPRHRTRAIVRVAPSEVRRAFCSNPELPAVGILEGMRSLQPRVDFSALTDCLNRLPIKGPSHMQHAATCSAAFSAYAALWCWWHGPAGYDVLGANTESYRLAPRLMDFEPGMDPTKT